MVIDALVAGSHAAPALHGFAEQVKTCLLSCQIVTGTWYALYRLGQLLRKHKLLQVGAIIGGSGILLVVLIVELVLEHYVKD